MEVYSEKRSSLLFSRIQGHFSLDFSLQLNFYDNKFHKNCKNLIFCFFFVCRKSVYGTRLLMTWSGSCGKSRLSEDTLI